MGGRTLNVAFAEPKASDQQGLVQQVKVSACWRLRPGTLLSRLSLECCIMHYFGGAAAGACMLQAVYVGNLPAGATDAKLKELFDAFAGSEASRLLRNLHLL